MSGLAKGMKRFLVERISGDQAVIKGQEAIHAKRVLRCQIGDRVLVLDAAGMMYRSRILSIAEEVVVQLEAALPAEPECDVKITLAQGVLKGEKMDFVVQKATELGVAAVVPLLLSRSVVKMDEKKKMERQVRWQRIAKEAVKQCGRTTIPVIHPVQTLPTLLADVQAYDCLLFPWEEEREVRLKTLLTEKIGCKNVLCIVGPEGGMTEVEAKLAKEAGGVIVTLGNRILRAETAALTMTSILQYTLGDLG